VGWGGGAVGGVWAAAREREMGVATGKGQFGEFAHCGVGVGVEVQIEIKIEIEGG
jgi:hypothetical protein